MSTQAQTADQASSNGSGVSNLKLSIFVILAGSFFAPVMFHATIIAIPAISQDLHISATQISWYSYLITIGNLLFVIPGGKVGDIYGHKRTYCAGILISALGCILGGVANDAIMLLMARFLTGLGMAFVWSNALALVNSIPPKEDRPKVMGFYIAVAYSGMVSGPILGGLIIEYFDWRFAFILPAIALLAVALTGLLFLKWEHYGDRGMKLNFVHTAMYMLVVGTLGGLSIIDNRELERIVLVSGALITFVFLWTQSRSKDPLLQTRLFTQSLPFTALSVGYAATYFSLFCIPFTLTLFLSFDRGMSATIIGWIIMVQAAGVVATSVLSGRLASKLSGAAMILSGVIVNCIGVLLMALIGSDVQLWFIIVTLLLLGVGVGLFEPALNRISLALAPAEYTGSAAAIIMSMRIVGGAFGMSLMSTMIFHQVGAASIDQSNIGQLVTLFQKFYVIGLGVMILALALLTYAAIKRPKTQ